MGIHCQLPLLQLSPSSPRSWEGKCVVREPGSCKRPFLWLSVSLGCPLILHLWGGEGGGGVCGTLPRSSIAWVLSRSPTSSLLTLTLIPAALTLHGNKLRELQGGKGRQGLRALQRGLDPYWAAGCGSGIAMLTPAHLDWVWGHSLLTVVTSRPHCSVPSPLGCQFLSPRQTNIFHF